MDVQTRSQLQDEKFELREFLTAVWQGRWIVLAITCAFVIGGAAYAVLATQLFKADVVMVQADESKSLSGNIASLGGLASLAGINLGVGGATQTPLAVLRSKELSREFITDRNLIKVLLSDQVDAKTGEWKIQDPRKQPDIRDAVEYFQKKVIGVAEDKKAGIVTLSITWRDPAVSAEWANELVRRVNAKMREQAMSEAERNIQYLKDEMAASNVTSLQQSIGRVLESEMQKLLLARGREEFSFKVVDPAVAPRKRFWPKRSLLIGGSAILGLFLSIVAVLVRLELRPQR